MISDREVPDDHCSAQGTTRRDGPEPRRETQSSPAQTQEISHEEPAAHPPSPARHARLAGRRRRHLARLVVRDWRRVGRVRSDPTACPSSPVPSYPSSVRAGGSPGGERWQCCTSRHALSGGAPSAHGRLLGAGHRAAGPGGRHGAADRREHGRPARAAVRGGPALRDLRDPDLGSRRTSRPGTSAWSWRPSCSARPAPALVGFAEILSVLPRPPFAYWLAHAPLRTLCGLAGGAAAVWSTRRPRPAGGRRGPGGRGRRLRRERRDPARPRRRRPAYASGVLRTTYLPFTLSLPIIWLIVLAYDRSGLAAAPWSSLRASWPSTSSGCSCSATGPSRP